jgi:hypothetical protein
MHIRRSFQGMRGNGYVMQHFIEGIFANFSSRLVSDQGHFGGY